VCIWLVFIHCCHRWCTEPWTWNWVRRVVETCNPKVSTKKIAVYNGHEVILWLQIRVQEADAWVRMTNDIFRWMGCFQRTEGTRIFGGITCSLFALSSTSDTYLTETWLPIRQCVDSTTGDHVTVIGLRVTILLYCISQGKREGTKIYIALCQNFILCKFPYSTMQFKLILLHLIRFP
jgi:hypothetical protein